MYLKLKDIKSGGLEQEIERSWRDFPELVAIAEEGGPKFTDPVLFHLRLQRVGQLVEVDGQLQTAVHLSCGRCLRLYDQPLQESFSVTFTPQPDDNDSLEEVELETDQLGLIHYDRDEILNLRDPLQEQLIMALPISPLCHDNCRGLCDNCGADLNRVRCSCGKRSFNNQFAALAALRSEGREKQ